MAATEKFYNGVNPANNVTVESPVVDAFVITPDDVNEINYITRGIYVGGDGNIKLKTKEGTTVTFYGVLAGTILPVRAVQIFATGTTAINLLGLV